MKFHLFYLSVLLIGCTTYPKQYTYSPTVTINGSSSAPLVLPEPYAKSRTYKNDPTPQHPTQRGYTVAASSYNLEPNRYYYNPSTGELYDSRQATDFEQPLF